MASLLAHAAVPLIARQAFATPPGFSRRLAVVAVLCACWPDLDLATLAFEVRPNELLGHRGLTHSLFVAAVVAVVAGGLGFRALGIGSRAWWRIVLFLFGAAASHGILDALTTGDIGVALFAPFENGRHLFPFKFLPVCPVGLNEYFGAWGMWTLANEVLYVMIPLAIVVSVFRDPELKRRMMLTSGAWLVGVILLRTAMPEYFTASVPRLILPVGTTEAGNPNDIPHDDLPNGKLVTRLDELRALGLFDTALAPANPMWSSSFFPAWFGGEGGRWADGAPRLVWRTLFGFQVPTEAQAKGWLSSSDPRIFTLAPTEKIDLAYGHFTFPASQQSLAGTHNRKPKPRYWNGRCNGIATASMVTPEPFRVVDVIGLDGSHVRFHPNDVKSLLALAYDAPKTRLSIGDVCDEVKFDAGATCSMNPAVLVLALLNRLGLAKDTFLIDALPTIAKQYYAVAGARVHLRGEPHPVAGAPVDPALAPRVASLIDVDIELTLSSTTLAYARANVLDPASPDGTRYKKVGVVPVVMKYAATLALDAASELVGGRWTGDPADGPDDVLIVRGGPTLTKGDKLPAADEISWAFVRELAKASADETAAVPTLDLRTQCDGRCP